MKIITVVGARPQFIKAAALSREIAKHASLNEIIVHTGQHFDPAMSDVFFSEMEIPKPAYNLGVHGSSHGAMTGRMLEKIEEVLMKEKPDMVIVFGDTNSTLAGALAARKLNIMLAHVEAGLRSFNMSMPEEVNRIVTDRISDILFYPGKNALSNLEKEGFGNFGCTLVNSGDVMYDAMLYYEKKAQQKSTILTELKLTDFILCTLHRAENTDDEGKLHSIIEALNKINDEIKVVMPLHPRTKKVIQQKKIPVRFTVIDPVGYFDMIQLTRNCRLVMTDSGGLQKEAYFFNKYCVTLRNETEWVELVNGGYNLLAGSDTGRIISSAKSLLDKKTEITANYYGDGNACRLIVEHLLKQYPG